MPNTNWMPASSSTRTTAWGTSSSSGIISGLLERGFDVLDPVRGRVAVEVHRPLVRAVLPAEPFGRRLREDLHDVRVHAPMPGGQRGRPPAAPAIVDLPVDLLDPEAAHLGRPLLAPEHAAGVLLPEEDVRQRVLHGPRRPSLRARH